MTRLLKLWMGLAVLLMVFSGVVGCGLTGIDAVPLPMTEASPAVVGYEISSGSEGTENSQYVLVKVFYDQAISVGSGAKADLSVTLNGEALNGDTMDYTVSGAADDPSVLEIRLSALPEAAAPGSGAFFALYNGELAITLSNSAGAAAIASTDGTSSVGWDDIVCIIPSGLGWEVVSTVTGDREKGVKAQLTVEVTRRAQIRVVTWVRLLSNGKAVMEEGFTRGDYTYTNEGSVPLHAHQFLIYREEDYAESLASQLEAFFGESGRYTFTWQGKQVVIEAVEAVDGEVLGLEIYL